MANLRLARGRYISDQDENDHASVAVIGDQVAKQFFPLRDPLGEEFRIGQRVVRVVGVLHPVGLAGGAGSALVGRDLNGPKQSNDPLDGKKIVSVSLENVRLRGAEFVC